MKSSPAKSLLPQKIVPKHGHKQKVQGSNDAKSKNDKSKKFSEKLLLLKLSTIEQATKSTSSSVKSIKKSTGKSEQKTQASGNILPFSMLPLILERHPYKSGHNAQTPTGTSGHSAGASVKSQLSKVTTNDLMKFLGVQAKSPHDAKSLPNWLIPVGSISRPVHPIVANTSTDPNQLITGLGQPTSQLSMTSSSGNHFSQGMPLQNGLKLTGAGFYEAMGNQISWMTGQSGNHVAQIQLHPPQLGMLVIHVKVNGHQTQILFQTQHALATQTLEASVPRLREMMTQTGQQVNVSVQQQAAGFGQPGQQHARRWATGSNKRQFSSSIGDITDAANPLTRWHVLTRGAVDTFV